MFMPLAPDIVLVGQTVSHLLKDQLNLLLLLHRTVRLNLEQETQSEVLAYNLEKL